MSFKFLSVVTILAAAGANSPAFASDNASWAKLNQDVAQRCAAASGLVRAHVSSIVGFDDTLGKVVTLVTGQEALRTRRGTILQSGNRLCIYDKRTKKVWIDEAAGWSAPALR